MKPQNSHHERGSALLLTLGLLSLVLILAMAFVFTSRTSRQIAQVNADQSKARLLAESALNHAIATLKNAGNGEFYPAEPNYNFNSFDITGLDNEVPPRETTIIQHYVASQQPHTTTYPDGVGSYTWTNNDYVILPILKEVDKYNNHSPENDRVTMEYMPIKDDEDNLVGRVAFLVLEEANKLDINQTLSLSGYAPFMSPADNRLAPWRDAYDLRGESQEPGFSPAHFFYDILGDRLRYHPWIIDEENRPEANTRRLGLQMQEIRVPIEYLDRLPAGYPDSDPIPPRPPNAQEVIPPKAPWLSYNHLWNRLWQWRALGNDDVFASQVSLYTVFSGEDIEAYWDGTTERQRFDLSGYEWRPWRVDPNDPDNLISPEDYYDANGQPVPAATGWQHPTADSGTPDAAQYARNLVAWLVGDIHPPSDPPSETTPDPIRASFWTGTSRTTPDTVPRFENPRVETQPLHPIPDRSDDVTSNLNSSYFVIPALRAMRNDTGVDISKQVAANLVDYSDSDSYATLPAGCDWNWGESGDVPPDYCGNEKVPYFNELHLEVTGSYKSDDNACTLKIVPRIEMFNIYADNLPSGRVRLKLFGTVTVTATLDDDSRQTVSDSPADPLQNTVGGTFVQYEADTVDVNAKSYAVLTCGDDPVVWSRTFTVPAGRTLDNLNYAVTITKVVLISGEDTADAATIQDIAFWHDATGQSVPVNADDAGVGTTHYGSLEISDCRSNTDLRPPATPSATPPATPSIPPATWLSFNADTTNHTLGADNSIHQNYLRSNDIDQEETFFAANHTYSTAYIRNAPMQSLWELGAIHRGEPFRTINLTRHTGPYPPANLPPGSDPVLTYTDGDAALLDQAKIGPARFMRGKFNANARNPQAINELLRGINLSDDYNSGGDYDVNSNPTISSWPNAVSEHRGAFADVLSGIGSPANNRAAEALIGRTAQLLTTRNDAYSVLAIGQVLKKLDVPSNVLDHLQDTLGQDRLVAIEVDEERTITNPDGTTDTIHDTRTDYYVIQATQRMLVHLVRDAWRNEISIQQTHLLGD